MTRPMVDEGPSAANLPGPGRSSIRRSYHCPERGYRFVVTSPAANPELWGNYLDGALANYRSHGVAEVLDYQEVRSGVSTSLFFAAVNAAGHVVGGVRAQGPYTCPEQSHALEEWAGNPGQDLVRTMIAERLTHGVIEIKTAWVADSATHRHELADCMPRTAVHAATLLGARFAFATSGEHALQRWTTTGAEIVATLTPVPYPDDRYRTSMLWLDRSTVAQRADSAQLRLLLAESAQLCTDASRVAHWSLDSLGVR